MLRQFVTGFVCLIVCGLIGNLNSSTLFAAEQGPTPWGDTTSKVADRIGMDQKPETFGAEANPTGDPIGGGKGYSRLVTQGDYHVKTAEELLAALEQAQLGQVIYVDGEAEIDLTGTHQIVIPGGVTLASCRGKGDSQGALIYNNKQNTCPLFLTGGDNVRVTGLRLRGPDPKRRAYQTDWLEKEGRYWSLAYSDGIFTTHSSLEVDNCEFWGWSHAAVTLKPGASKAHIHHNYIHHNQRQGMGYAVGIYRADGLIEANLFDWLRHCIGASGRPGERYEARYNIVLEHVYSQSFDMHGGKDRKDGTNIAGDWINIHHNTVYTTWQWSVVIRGIPTEAAYIHHNWFMQPNSDDAILQKNAMGNMHVYRNQYGPARILKD